MGSRAHQWTAERDSIIAAGWRDGKTIATIRAEMGGFASSRAISDRAHAIGLGEHPRASRRRPDVDELVGRMWAEGKLVGEIAEALAALTGHAWAETAVYHITRRVGGRRPPSVAKQRHAEALAQWSQKARARRGALAVKLLERLNAGVPFDLARKQVGATEWNVAAMVSDGMIPRRPRETFKAMFRPNRGEMNPGFQLIGKQDQRGPRADATADIAAWIAANGVTRCPVAALAPTTATIPPADAAAIRQHDDEVAAKMAKEWRRRTWPGPKGKQKVAA